MATVELDVRDQIVAFKRTLAPNRDALKRAYDEVKDHVSRAADSILRDVAAGRPVVPELDYRDIRDGTGLRGRSAVDPEQRVCGDSRSVPGDLVASDWFAEVGEYLETNRYEEREVEKRSLDKYFSALKAGKPQIFNVYWSRPQVMARQDPAARRDASVSRSAVEIRRCVQSRPPVHVRRPGAAAAARGQDAWHFLHTWTRARSSAGSTPAIRRCTSTSSRVTGAGMTRSTPGTGWRPARFRRRRCAACSAPIRAGRR